MKLKSFFLTLVGLLFHFLTYSQSNTGTVQDISQKIKKYFINHRKEKAYLQLDKPYYFAGDTIYFKAYLTSGERHELSSLSGVLYVDLINPLNKIEQSERLQVVDGVAWGDFSLADTVVKGYYQIRAYTKYMLNDSLDNFYLRRILIGSFEGNSKSPTLPDTSGLLNAQKDFQVFPEGGNLITDIQSKIAFKEIGSDGKGDDVKGVIVDDQNREICSFSSTHLGMGYFYLKPEKERTYKAKLNYADGSQNTVELPKPELNGISLTLNNDSVPKVSVKIETNGAFYASNKNNYFYLCVYSGGVVSVVTCKLDSQKISFDILKRHLPSGIATVSLLSSTGEPLCERLFFVQNYNQLNLSVVTDKKEFGKREKVNIKLNAQDRAGSPSIGHFSISVIDESKVPLIESAESTIFTYLLLTSDLKGYIENPGYYFNGPGLQATNKDLDLVMLTHGYRKFEWKKIISDEYPPVNFEPEKGISINGSTTSLWGRPIKKGAVYLIPSQGGAVLNSLTDNQGSFHFENLLFTDTATFVLNATNANGKDLTKIRYTEAKRPIVPPFYLTPEKPDVNQLIATYIKNDQKQQGQLNLAGFSKGKMLREVKITAKATPVVLTKYGIPDQVVSGDKILYGGQLSIRLAGLIHFHKILHRPTLIVWDGVEMPRNFDIDQINTGSIESIEAITDATANGPDYENILIINTYRGLQPKDMVATGILPIKVNGFYKAREFYSPKYDGPGSNSKLQDLRSTIYWNPEIITDKDGNASFGFYNSDDTGNYKMIIEGISSNGNIGRIVYRYSVK